MWVSKIKVKQIDWGWFPKEIASVVEFGGCPLRCPGFGASTPIEGVTSCINYSSVLPQYQSEWKSMTPSHLHSIVDSGPPLIALSGGEPLFQAAAELTEFVRLLGPTRPIVLWTSLSMAVPAWVVDKNRYLLIDVKLPSSGEYGATILSSLKSLDMLRVCLSFTIVRLRDLGDIEKSLGQIYLQNRKGSPYQKIVLVLLDDQYLEAAFKWASSRPERIQIVTSELYPSLREFPRIDG